MANTLTWTLLPNGVDLTTGRARLSLVAHPSVESPSGELNDTPLSVWPALLAAVGRLRVQVAESGQLLDAERVEPAAVDPTAWAALFPLDTRVAAGPGPGDDGPFSSLVEPFDYALAHAAAATMYEQAVASSPTELIGPDHPVARTLAAMGAALRTGPRRAAAADPAAEALAAVVRHVAPARFAQPTDGLVVPPTPAPLDDVTPIEEADIHQVLTLVRDHPALARLLGIVIDLTVPATDALRGTRTLRITGDGGAPLHGSFDQVSTPWSRTECDLDSGLFVMATRPGPGTEIVRGMLDLTPDTTKYVIGTIDVSGAARRLGALGVELARRDAGETAAAPPLGLPARYDTGFTIAQTGRHGGTVQHAAQAHARYLEPANQLQGQPVLYADDVTAGYRFDVARENGPFRSLMRRVARYRIGPTAGRNPLVVHDEGIVEPLVAVQQDTADGVRLSVLEEIAGWAGWSLGAPMPGLAVTAERAGEPAVAAVAPQAAPGYDLTVDIAAEPGSLERLRYGQRYRFRARAADLAGNSLSTGQADRADTAGFTSPPTRFSRTETVSAPVLLLRGPLRAGERPYRLVVTTDGDGNPLEPRTARHLAPPSAAQLLTERHGLFDGALGPQASSADRDRLLALASRESASFADPLVPRPGGGTMPAPGLTVVAPAGQTPATLPLPPGVPLPAGQYLVHDTDLPVVPHLPDFAAAGATLIAPGADPGEVTTAPYGGRWPDPLPVRLTLQAQDEHKTPLVVAGSSGGRGTLEVSLPPGTETTMSLSSAVRPEAMDVMEPVSPTVRALALLGQVPTVSPRETVTFLHATRKPLDRLVWKQTGPTITGRTRLLIGSEVNCHRASTAKLDLVASWDEIIDSGYGPLTTVRRTAVLGSKDVPTGPDAPFPWVREYDFGDTRRRDLSLRLVGSTRYRDCFPELTDDDPRGQRSIDLPPLVRQNTRRPGPPEVAAIVPTYRWVRTKVDGAYRSTRERAGVRVWLKRPWMTTGPGEALGVVVWSTTGWASLLQNLPFNLQQMTRWGVDLIEENGPRAGSPFTAASFPAGQAHPEDLVEISSFSEAPNDPPATVMAHEVRFDAERQQWFADVDVDIPDGRPAMLRLGLVRYQPQSQEGARVSRMVTTDWVPLQPPRTVQVRSLSPTGVDLLVTVTGKHTEDRAFVASVRPRLLDPPPGAAPGSVPTDLVTMAGAAWVPLPVATGSDGTFNAIGRLTSTSPSSIPRLRAGRVVIEEYHGGYKIRTDDETSRIEWAEVVDFSAL